MVNDHSSDQGPSLILKQLNDFPLKISLLNLEKEEGKKAAISKGVENTRAELILTTDADCRMGVNWVHSFDEIFREEGADLITGRVDLKGNSSFLSAFQLLDQSILMGLTERYCKANRSILANGANMAFRRELFENHYLENRTLSGDDVFLLYALKRNKNSRIIFNSSSEATITTFPKNGIADFLSQRLRWASKSRYYKDLDSIFMGGILFLTNIILITLFFTSLSHGISPHYFLAFLGGKLFLDLTLMASSSKYLDDKRSLFWLPIYTIAYPFYSVGIALLSLLIKPKWKGRTV